eukprot:maker-scaffold385_size188773-snap-gene-0.22 protein:Tk10808 transcript:maker-scaffold385_size188773-snap-gene-0.22-mRNA-1 annotation:"rmd5-like protein a"
MDSILSVEKELSTLSEKFNKFDTANGQQLVRSLEVLRNTQKELNQVRSSGAALTPSQTFNLMKTVQGLNEVVNSFASVHRDLHSSVSKVGKAIDRNFVTDYDSTSRDDIFRSSEQQKRLNEVILQHFHRQGLTEISESLAQEAKLEDAHVIKDRFQELNAIVDALAERSLTPALEWSARNRDKMGTGLLDRSPDGCNRAASILQSSSLEMKLHKLWFIDLLAKGKCMEAVGYARHYFPHFVKAHEKEVQALMGALMFAASGKSLSDSPYAHLLDPILWQEIVDQFVRNACALMGLSIESPLSVVINAGCTALPALLNIKQVMQQRQVAGAWNPRDELPIEIDLGPECRFHSIFACPILRQQTTEQNPPLRLTCGHCISKDALTKLTAGHKLKCPYCPVEQNPNDARQVFF